MRRHSLIAAAIAVLVAGCSMAPKYERPEPPVSTNFPTGGVYATQPGAADAGARNAFEISLISQVAAQYLQVLQADDLLQVTEQTLKTAQESYDIVKLQFDNGTASELDLSQSQTVVETAAANYQAQQRARAQAVNALVLLIGEPIPDELPSG